MEINLSEDLKQQIHLAKSGDEAAFEYLYKELYNPLFKYVLFKTKNKDLTEDIVAQVFTNWYNSLKNYEVKMKPINYLITIANRLLINEGLRKKADYFIEDAEELISDKSESIENLLNINVDFEKVKIIIDENLNEMESEVINLKYIFDKTNTEIAEMLGKAEGNVRVIEHRALVKIRNVHKQKYEVKI